MSTIHRLSHPTLARSPTLPSPTPRARRAKPLSKVWKLRLLGARITEIVEKKTSSPFPLHVPKVLVPSPEFVTPRYNPTSPLPRAPLLPEPSVTTTPAFV